MILTQNPDLSGISRFRAYVLEGIFNLGRGIQVAVTNIFRGHFFTPDTDFSPQRTPGTQIFRRIAPKQFLARSAEAIWGLSFRPSERC